MAIAKTVKWFLDSHNLSYEVIQHPHTSSSEETADAAYIWGDQLAKSVVLEDERGYVMAVLPASRRVDLKKLRRKMHRKLELATETELGEIFRDCEIGAIPPLWGPPTAFPWSTTTVSGSSGPSTSRAVTTRTWSTWVARNS